MWLLLVYVIIGAASELAAAGIGLYVEHLYSSTASLPVFLALFFANLWLAWRLAIIVTRRLER